MALDTSLRQDPWAGANQQYDRNMAAYQMATRTIMAGNEAAARRKQEALENEAMRIKLDEAKRQIAGQAEARAAYQNANQYEVTTPNPAYVSPDQYQSAVTTGPPQQVVANENGEASDPNTYRPVYPTEGASQQDIMSAYAPVAPVETKTVTPDRTKAMLDVYAKNQDFTGFKNALDADKLLAQYQSMGTNPTEYYKAKATLDNAKEAFGMIKDFAKSPTLLKQMWPLVVKAYPQAANINPETIVQTADGVAVPVTDKEGNAVADKYMLYDKDGKLHIVDGKEAPEKMQIVEIPSPDGKTAQKYSVNVSTSTKTPIGEPYKLKSQVFNVNTGEKKERDLPPSIQEKLQSKLEIYSDWKTLKDDFKPSYMPKTPFKNIGELQVNLNKIFANNPAAADWWTKYFDARNILLKDRSGAAVVEGEFKRFEQGSISANTDPKLVQNYLDRSVNKYGQHKDAFINANKKNHPEGVKAFEDAFGTGKPETPTQPNRKPVKSGRFVVEAL